jgi:DNA polymerase-1
MLQLGDRHFLVESPADLPEPRPGARMFTDCETRRRGDDLTQGGLEPYLGDRACGWAVCWDEGPAYYVPIRHRNSSKNVELGPVLAWLKRLVEVSKEWVNHNVKFDAHFAAVDGAVFKCRLVDTMSLAKVVESDRMGYGLKMLCRDMLNIIQDSADRVGAFLRSYKLERNRRANDYALVPVDLLGYYGCDDVLNTRDLFVYLMSKLDPDVKPTWDLEQELTPVLWDIERIGLRTDRQELQLEQVKSLGRQIQMATRINALTGLEYVDSSAFSYELLVAQWGLPVLSRNKENGNPSFDKEALELYLVHPEVVHDNMKMEVLKTLTSLRKESTYCSLFVQTFLESADERGFIHSDYNQIVRTGRMSCRNPNAQQWDERAKYLVRTDSDGMAFLDADASQVEFRVIAHYINDADVINAYNTDPKTDFHQWVADLCRIKRKPAKTINFAMAYGSGQKNTIQALSGDPDVIAEVTGQLTTLLSEGRVQEANRLLVHKDLCAKKGAEIFRVYHERLPTLKPVTRKATDVARARGFIFNVYGRRRHLPPQAAHKAFNSLCQGTAMDVIKRRMLVTCERNWPELAAAGITLRANIHDALLWHGPKEEVRRMAPEILARLEVAEPKLRVPIRWDHKIVEQRWGARK